MTHGDDVRPIRETVDEDEVILSCVRAEVTSYFLEWTTWFGFKGDWFTWTMLSILLSIPGQYTVSLALCLVRTAP